MARYNWSKIRAEYVAGSMSQRELAKKHGVSASQLAARASKEGWVEKRKNHRGRVAEKAEQKLLERNAGVIADQLNDIRKAGDNLATLIAAVSGEAKSIRVGRSKKADTKAIKNLTSALRDVLDVLRDVYDLPNLRERAKLETQTGAKEVRVVFEAEEPADAQEGGAEGVQAQNR